MIFNTDKCEVLQTAQTIYSTRIVDHTKYLGVLLDPKLNFNKHIANICGKASSALALLKHNLYSCNSQVQSQVYFLYV